MSVLFSRIWFCGSLKRQFVPQEINNAHLVYRVNDRNMFITNIVICFFILTGTEVGSVLTAVTANDVDTYPPLKYALIQGDDQFSIDRYNGKIILNKPLDFERKKLYEINVTASDSEHVAKTKLTIKVTDVNDNAPVFDEISYNRVLPGELVLKFLKENRGLFYLFFLLGWNVNLYRYSRLNGSEARIYSRVFDSSVFNSRLATETCFTNRNSNSLLYCLNIVDRY